MNEMQVFQNNEFGELGVLEIEGKPYFPATACAKLLGYTNPRKAILDHCKEDGVTKRDVIDTLGRTQSAKFINEGNLYRLITHSKLPTAERFEKWVFDEVLPTIRKTGSYGNQSAMMDNWLDKLVQITANLTKAVTVMTTVMERVSNTAPASQPQPSTFPPANSLKLETFPPEIIQEVDGMLEGMIQQQALNFSMIARYCTMNGYTISSPSVKRYFDRHFNEN